MDLDECRQKNVNTKYNILSGSVYYYGVQYIYIYILYNRVLYIIYTTYYHII